MTIPTTNRVLRRLAPLALAAVATACGSPRPTPRAASAAPGRVAKDATAADSAARRSGAADSVATGAPGESQHLQAAALEGMWSLRAVEPGRRGPRLVLAIDSARDSSFRTRVVFLMQGDVGLDPSRFTPTRGTIAADRTVRLTIQLEGRAEPTGALAGTLGATGDTIRLGTFDWGGANQAAGGVHWLLVREP